MVLLVLQIPLFRAHSYQSKREGEGERERELACIFFMYFFVFVTVPCFLNSIAEGEVNRIGEHKRWFASRLGRLNGGGLNKVGVCVGIPFTSKEKLHLE